jgi:pimeloyl-ACP methyl ester carboxylesterase
VAWLLAAMYPGRVHKLVILSVPHPLAPGTLRQREMAWYQLFFQFEGIAEAWLQHDDWALFREVLRGNGDVDPLHLRSITTRRSNGFTELVPRKPRTATTGIVSPVAARGSSNTRHLVHE